MKLLFSAVALLAAATPSIAHDMWIAAPSFSVEEIAVLPISLRVGHADEQDRWNASWDRIHSFRSYGPDGVEDQQATLIVPHEIGPNANVTLKSAGTHIVALESYQASSTLQADEFNAYLATEGLDLAAKTRADAGTTDTPGVEVYSRRAKMLVQVGALPSSNVLKPVGHTLEIVPVVNPYDRRTETALPVRVLFQGRPLAAAQVRVLALGVKNARVQKLRTDEQGQASFLVPSRGAWLVMAVHARPTTDNPDATFDTVFASLTFGFKK